MKHERTWGTQLELQAAASLLKLPIYVFTQKDGSGDYYWEIFKPINSPLRSPDTTIEKPLGVHHYELCHTQGCHYDLIVQGDGRWPIEPPFIKTQHIYLDI